MVCDLKAYGGKQRAAALGGPLMVCVAGGPILAAGNSKDCCSDGQGYSLCSTSGGPGPSLCEQRAGFVNRNCAPLLGGRHFSIQVSLKLGLFQHGRVVLNGEPVNKRRRVDPAL